QSPGDHQSAAAQQHSDLGFVVGMRGFEPRISGPTPDDVPDDPIDVAPPAPCPTAGDLFGRVAALLDHDRRRAASTSHELSG
ncbi:MAG: hypothetical protein M3524_09125, partial [Actinomycetota bacterium]|nr:hypothetical protein [Actinomycetota bacterium]